jgi:uncharacterized membrane protein
LITASLICSPLASQKKESINLIFFVTFLGIIHGLGFSNYFKAILYGSATSKLLPLEFAVELKQRKLL